MNMSPDHMFLLREVLAKLEGSYDVVVIDNEIVEESPPTQRRTARRSEQPPVSQPAAGEEPVENAPRTHRLDQVTANNLRAGWLAARRRGEVTISRQEYAGRIIALGLAEEARQLAE